MNKSDSPKMTPDELRQWLEFFDMSEQELAETIEVTKPAVDHWLAGRREMPSTTVRLLKFFLKHPTLIGEF